MNGRMFVPARRGLASGGKNKILKFPEGFLWGAATSAHQVEGGTRNDWTEWEKKNAKRLSRKAKTKWADWQQKKFPEMFDPENYISATACDHYNRYEEDFDIAKSLGHNAHRFSIEWSRIEPEEGKFDEREIEHYRKVIAAIRARGMEPFVTLWHFTNPLWVSNKGGWENQKTIDYFIRFSKKVIAALGDNVEFWITFNETPTYAGHTYLLGEWLSRKKSFLKTNKVIKNICLAHRKVFELTQSMNKKGFKIGIVFNLKHHSPCEPDNIFDRILAKIDEFFRDTRYLEMIINHSDFIGLNYYFHDRMCFALGGKFFGLANIKNPNKEISDLGWDISPEGIYHVIMRLKKYNLPIYITENGLADAEDKKREKFIKDHLRWVHKAIQHGVDVRGYFHWSLLDNFEWDKGFWPRFGLVEIDYKTMERKIRPSAWEYAKICKSNQLSLE
jgi:beta-glucosidase